MKEVSEDLEEEGESSDISGYHSDSESAVMTSGNSPFISKEARYSFLSRSGESLEIFVEGQHRSYFVFSLNEELLVGFEPGPAAYQLTIL